MNTSNMVTRIMCGIRKSCVAFCCRLLPVKSQQCVQLCGFVFHDNPSSLQHFPFNMSLVEYGFQANYDFDTHCKKYADYGWVSEEENIFSFLSYCCNQLPSSAPGNQWHKPGNVTLPIVFLFLISKVLTIQEGWPNYSLQC